MFQGARRCKRLLLLLLFLTFSALVAKPNKTKLLYTVANPARGLLNRGKKKKKKSLPPRMALFMGIKYLELRSAKKKVIPSGRVDHLRIVFYEEGFFYFRKPTASCCEGKSGVCRNRIS